MRDRVYWLFALVAWPAALWGVIEFGLRVLSGYGEGTGANLMLTMAAGATIAVTGWRRQGIRARESQGGQAQAH